MEQNLERGEVVNARSFLTLMKSCGDGDMQAIITTAFAEARLELASGNGDEAVDLLERLRPDVEHLCSHEFSDSLELALGYVFAQLGRCESAAPWIRSGKVSTSPHGAAVRRPFTLMVYGKLLAAAGEFQLLDSVARTMPIRFGAFASLLGRIHAKVLEGIAARHLGRTEDALALMKEAVELSRPDGLIFSIAEYGGLVSNLLRMLRRVDPNDHYVERIAVLAERIRKNSAPAENRTIKNGPLTRREREIMQLVLQGKSNPDIARALGVSDSSVQKMLSSVYAKLGAANRAEASRRFTLEYGADQNFAKR